MHDGANSLVYTNTKSKTVDIAVNELKEYWHGSPVYLKIDDSLPHNDGYRISFGGRDVTIKASSNIGILYGAYDLLRRQQTNALNNSTDKWNAPAFSLRILDHWDNLDGSIERGYAGKSLWKWQEITSKILNPKVWSPVADRIRQYARANASIGINGSVLNNVNASSKILSGEYINKVKIIADILRPYGIKVYLSVNFASPMSLGGLKTADPLDYNA